MDTAVSLLVVDDEPLIAEMIKDALEEGGFQVIVANTAEQALAALDEHSADGLAGVITDVNLGSKTSGWNIARRARELRSDLPIVYMSGFASDDWPVEGVPNSLVVRKPFAAAQVVTAIATLINKAASQPGAGQ